MLAKVALGEADAGFVYSTDARTVLGKVTVLKLPGWAQPKAQYGIAQLEGIGPRTSGTCNIKRPICMGSMLLITMPRYFP